MSIRSKIGSAAVILFTILTVVVVVERMRFESAAPLEYGVSFNPDHARYLGLNPAEVFRTIVEDWKFKKVRLPVQWNTVEVKKDSFNFTEIDSLMAEAEKHGVKVILVVGQKTPRWPECHLPDWAAQLSASEYTARREKYIGEVVKHYKSNAALELWQVENEPFLEFGACPPFTADDLKNEISLVKKSDAAHPTIVTDSGELHFWGTTARAGDYFGSTLYRIIWNQRTGYFHYDWLPAAWYRFKLWLAGRSPTTAFVIELQAEPWMPDKPFMDVTENEQNKSMNLPQLEKNIAFANSLGFARVYLWGAEWWYWQAQQGSFHAEWFWSHTTNYEI
jgi:hypothetical protein